MPVKTPTRVVFSQPERIALILLLVLAVSIALFYIPSISTPLDYLRTVVVEILVLAVLVLWLITHISQNRVRIPRSIALFGMVTIMLLSLASSLFIGVTRYSIIGWGVETTTVLTLFFLVLLIFLTQALLDSRAKIRLMLITLGGSAFVAMVYTLLRIILTPLLGRYAWFLALPPSIVGSWNEIALFAGATALGIALAHDVLSLHGSRMVRIGSQVLYAVALLVLAFINHSTTWIILGLTSIVCISAVLLRRRSLRTVPLYVTALLVISVVFYFGGKEGSVIGDSVARANAFIGVPSALSQDMRPTFSDTARVTLGALKNYPVLGVGPNNFNYAWMRYRPVSHNQSVLWSSDFSQGWSYFFTFPALLGAFGILALILCIGGIVIDTFVVLSLGNRSETAPLPFFVALLSLYASLILLLYPPGIVWLFIFSLLFGLMIAVGRDTGAIGALEFEYGAHTRVAFLSTIAVPLLIVFAAGLGYLVANKAWARSLYFTGVNAVNTLGDLGTGESSIGRALLIDNQDVYGRALSTVGALKLARVVQDSSLSRDQMQSQFLQTMKLSLDSASSSVTLNPRSYQNLISLGGAYETAALYGVRGGREQALATYESAAKLAPTHPLIPFISARVETSSGNNAGARRYLEAALKLKPDYIDAILLLSQIEAASENFRSAATIAERAFVIAPNNVGVLFQFGYLKYKNGSYEDARLILERAKVLAPNYSNAKYFLGLTYDALGKDDAALSEFRDISRLNPSNEEVRKIISNISNGFPALSGVGEPTTPEPIEEEDNPKKTSP